MECWRCRSPRRPWGAASPGAAYPSSRLCGFAGRLTCLPSGRAYCCTSRRVIGSAASTWTVVCWVLTVEVMMGSRSMSRTLCWRSGVGRREWKYSSGSWTLRTTVVSMRSRLPCRAFSAARRVGSREGSSRCCQVLSCTALPQGLGRPSGWRRGAVVAASALPLHVFWMDLLPSPAPPRAYASKFTWRTRPDHAQSARGCEASCAGRARRLPEARALAPFPRAWKSLGPCTFGALTSLLFTLAPLPSVTSLESGVVTRWISTLGCAGCLSLELKT
mmetsp:Transcript_18074/g.63504  ORF Transcript_18074/g.63504 Transcript_18074/m.63504 type:complete len:275 (+) Transcript_18074:176-1000(+)